MPSYAEPDRWNKETVDATSRRREIEKAIASTELLRDSKRTPLASDKQHAAEDAGTEHVLNTMEADTEDMDQRIADQYPAGTQHNGKTSRNRAGYGKKVDLPKE